MPSKSQTAAESAFQLDACGYELSVSYKKQFAVSSTSTCRSPVPGFGYPSIGSVSAIGIGPGSLSSPYAVKFTGICACCAFATVYGIPIVEPWYSPEPKSACRPIVPPMKLMIAVELESTVAVEMSLFQRLADEKGTKPFKFAPWPIDIWLQPEACCEAPTWKFTLLELLLPGSGFVTVIE